MFGVMRLSELLAAKKVKRPPWWSEIAPDVHLNDDIARLRWAASRAERFQIQNVAEYFYHASGKPEWSGDQDFPCIAPPFPFFWMEYTIPKMVLDKDGLVRNCFAGEGVGLMFQASDAASFKEEYHGMLGEHPKLSEGFSDAKWALSVTGYAFPKGQPPFMPLLIAFIPVMADGRPGQQRPYCLLVGWDRKKVDHEGYCKDMGWVSAMVAPALMALTFLNCKNVTTREVSPDDDQEKRWVARHRKPSFRYKVLHIEPMTRIIRQAVESGGATGRCPIHICRGHFKDYREHGLFGKRHGVYWWDHHLRGDKKNGVVAKDYAVSPESTPAAAPVRARTGTGVRPVPVPS